MYQKYISLECHYFIASLFKRWCFTFAANAEEVWVCKVLISLGRAFHTLTPLYSIDCCVVALEKYWQWKLSLFLVGIEWTILFSLKSLWNIVGNCSRFSLNINLLVSKIKRSFMVKNLWSLHLSFLFINFMRLLQRLWIFLTIVWFPWFHEMMQ